MVMFLGVGEYQPEHVVDINSSCVASAHSDDEEVSEFDVCHCTGISVVPNLHVLLQKEGIVPFAL